MSSGPATEAAAFSVPWNEPTRVPLPEHLYVHVPLCRSKCAYCDFFSLADDGAISRAELVRTTIELLRGWLSPAVARVPLKTLYIGGGTPTVLGDDLLALIGGLTAAMPLAPGAEVTVEGNPDSLDERLIGGLKDAGVTRLSIGVQSLHDDALRLLGRAHDAAAAVEAVRAATAAGLEVSADLICGVPGVSAGAWLESVRGVLDAGARHVSVYPLSVEPGTPLAAAIAGGRVPAPDEDAAVDAMEAAARELQAAGLMRYEVANYALPGLESRHNSAYWTGRPYLGVGGGAHGMLTRAQACALALVEPEAASQGGAEGADIGRVRYGYAQSALPAQERSPLAFIETLTTAEAAREDAMLGMRMSAGIDEGLARRAGTTGAMDSLVRDGLVTHSEGRYRPTVRGWLFGNEVFSRIWGAIE